MDEHTLYGQILLKDLVEIVIELQLFLMPYISILFTTKLHLNGNLGRQPDDL